MVETVKDFYLIGLTGNLGCGKSTVRRMLEQLGARGIDADLLAHAAMVRGTPAWNAIVKSFGADILRFDGEIDRQRLGKLVFGKPEELRRLEEILHPAVGELVKEILRQNEKSVVVLEAIKLIESGLYQWCDALWVVTCSPEALLERVARDRRMRPEDAQARLAAQGTEAEKRRLATVVIDNSGDASKTRTQVEKAWAETVHVEKARDKSAWLFDQPTASQPSAPTAPVTEPPVAPTVPVPPPVAQPPEQPPAPTPTPTPAPTAPPTPKLSLPPAPPPTQAAAPPPPTPTPPEAPAVEPTATPPLPSTPAPRPSPAPAPKQTPAPTPPSPAAPTTPTATATPPPTPPPTPTPARTPAPTAEPAPRPTPPPAPDVPPGPVPPPAAVPEPKESTAPTTLPPTPPAAKQPVEKPTLAPEQRATTPQKARPAQGNLIVQVRPARRSDMDALSKALAQAEGRREPLSAAETLKRLGERGYRIALAQGRIVAMAAWEAENLVAITRDIRAASPEIARQAFPPLLSLIEQDANSLVCEVSILLTDARTPSVVSNAATASGYRITDLDSLHKVWRQVISERLKQGERIWVKPLRKELITRPVE